MTNIFKHVLCIAFFAITPFLHAQWYFELASNDTHFSDYSISRVKAQTTHVNTGL
ncbi:MAG: hypothetical protein P8I58_00765 [Flavobacteriaceae bacterium]|jgi:hypothetical protein|nr:hypothetical protein [Flavobacteriaceae bacterium]